MSKEATEPMPDAEAERLLRVLAEQLRWEAQGRHAWAVVAPFGG